MGLLGAYNLYKNRSLALYFHLLWWVPVGVIIFPMVIQNHGNLKTRSGRES